MSVAPDLKSRMKLKRLGSSLLQVPEIGLGTWRYSGGVLPLQAAIDYGACLIDTAEIYGSEEVVGEAIRGRRAQVILATKAAPRHFRAHDLVVAAEHSLRRLATDYIDLYQLHWPSYITPIEETMSAMARLVDAGKIRHIGVSNFSVRQLKKAQAVLPGYRIVSNQVRYSLIERTIERGLLEYCQQNEVAVLAYSPLGTDFCRFRAADPDRVLDLVSASAQKTPAQVALNWLIQKPNVIAIPKASSVHHAIEDCGASGWRLDPRDYLDLEQKIEYSVVGSLTAGFRACKRFVAQSLGRQL